MRYFDNSGKTPTLAELYAAVRESPEDADARAALARGLANADQNEAASPEFQQAARLELRSALLRGRYHIGAGYAPEELGDAEGAIRELEEGVRLCPTQDSARHALSVLLYEKGDVEGALRQAREIMAAYEAGRISERHPVTEAKRLLAKFPEG